MEEKVITINDKKYPELLRGLKNDAPKKLYYKGDWEESKKSRVFENCLAVVGSRRMTTYGRQITQKLISEIAGFGVTIVSGFMYGIDATAHQAAVDVGGRTIAVMPCGINLIHPEYQQKLYNQILENNGLIISEFEKNFPPAIWTYPKRNRIVAGFSKAVLVVEAGEKSGSLITANFARKYNRKLFVVPCPLTSSVSKGISQLIKEGAEVISCAKDILNFFNLKNSYLNFYKCAGENFDNGKKENNDSIEHLILQELKKEPMKIDELSRLIKKSAADIGMILSLMQLKGQIFSERGKYYAK